MSRFVNTLVCVALLLALTSSRVESQQPMVGIAVGTTIGGYGGFAPGYAAYGPGFGGWGGGYSPAYGGYGGYGLGYGGYGLGYGGYGLGYGGYGAFSYAQQSFRQQALVTQQIFLQQQQALLGRIAEAQGRLEKLDEVKQRLFKRYLDMSEADKAAVRAGLMDDYLQLDDLGREGWKRDAVVQAIVGQDVFRLDGVAEYRAMSGAEQVSFRRAMLEKYQNLPPGEQRAWQGDQIVSLVMGSDWWQK
jgi:hypothetical protein